MEGYADRPAVGQRAVKLQNDPDTGRTALALLPRFETITYGQLWDRVGAVASALADDPVRPGDRVCILGFSSIEYTTVDLAVIKLGAVSVPLRAGAPVTELRPIVADTQPSVIAASVDDLDEAVESVITGHMPARLVVLGYRAEVDDHREALEAANEQLRQAGSPVVAETLADLLECGSVTPSAPEFISDEKDPLRLVIYTSGSTGTPKGAMHTDRIVTNTWLETTMPFWNPQPRLPLITLNFLPMSLNSGRSMLYGTLGTGGTVYFAPKSDLSTLFEDLSLVRPTLFLFVPRILDMLFQEFQREVDRRVTDGGDRAAVEAEVMAGQRQNLLGGRYGFAQTGAAPISPQMKAWVEDYLDMHLTEMYGSTECRAWIVDGHVRRPPAIDYKLIDVPDLGYFHTDRPHPRGEVLVTSELLFAGYYNRPDVTAEVFDADGYYKTGDIFAELGPDQLQYVDRATNVLKLSYNDFVTVSKLEAAFQDSPLIWQIYIYGNSARPYLLAVVVPTEVALTRGDVESLKPVISESLQDVAETAGLQVYEIPRDFIIEMTPFTPENGLLTGMRKLARPKLKQRYGERLEQLYTELADAKLNELRRSGAQGRSSPAANFTVREL